MSERQKPPDDPQANATDPVTGEEGAIVYSDVHKAFGDFEVLRGLDLIIPRGKITAIIGRSGTGKSVTMKHVMGLLRCDKGKIWVGDDELTTMADRKLRKVRNRFGIVFQHAALFDSMNVFDNVAFPLREHTRLRHSAIADKVSAPTFPIPLPVIAASRQERDALLSQKMIRAPRDLSARTDVRFVGVGSITETAPLVMDGFITRDEQQRLLGKGAAGEIVGYVYDAAGRLLEDEINDRVSSADLGPNPGFPTIAAAHGPEKVGAIRAALDGHLVNGLITDEETAVALTA